MRLRRIAWSSVLCSPRDQTEKTACQHAYTYAIHTGKFNLLYKNYPLICFHHLL